MARNFATPRCDGNNAAQRPHASSIWCSHMQEHDMMWPAHASTDDRPPTRARMVRPPSTRAQIPCVMTTTSTHAHYDERAQAVVACALRATALQHPHVPSTTRAQVCVIGVCTLPPRDDDHTHSPFTTTRSWATVRRHSCAFRATALQHAPT